MPKKRTSRGRTKGGKGSSGTVHCSQCGAMVPRDKAKKVTGRITLVEPTLADKHRRKFELQLRQSCSGEVCTDGRKQRHQQCSCDSLAGEGHKWSPRA